MPSLLSPEERYLNHGDFSWCLIQKPAFKNLHQVCWRFGFKNLETKPIKNGKSGRRTSSFSKNVTFLSITAKQQNTAAMTADSLVTTTSRKSLGLALLCSHASRTKYGGCAEPENCISTHDTVLLALQFEIKYVTTSY